MSDEQHRVARRRVFYIPGYDPFPPRRYRELYRKEAAEQARISGHSIAVKPGLSQNGWRVEANVEGQNAVAEVEVLVWSDLVQASMGQGIVATYWQLLRTAWVYVATGALLRLARLRKGPTIAALYPIGVLLGELAVAIAAGWAVFGGVVAFLPGYDFSGVVGGMVGALIVWLVLAGFRRIDGKVFAWYLMHDYAHSARLGGAYPDDLRQRLSVFSGRITEALTEDWDEVLVVGHSSGAHMAVTAVAEALRNGQGQQVRPALSLLTLGHVVPMISFLPGAEELRRDLRSLSEHGGLIWVDVTAPGDGCAFALCDPVAVSGVATGLQRWPLVLSAAFSQTLSPARWRELRRRYFRLHFQYLCAFDNLSGSVGDYDYFAITSGPLTLAQRLGGRRPSASRIVTPLSPYRSLAETVS